MKGSTEIRVAQADTHVPLTERIELKVEEEVPIEDCRALWRALLRSSELIDPGILEDRQ